MRNDNSTHSKIESLLSQIQAAPGNEVQLQDRIAQILQMAGIVFDRECATATGPVDFIIGDVALEIKTSGSPTAIARQLIRYLNEERFRSLILVTTRPIALPLSEVETAHGTKPIHVIDLWRNFL